MRKIRVRRYSGGRQIDFIAEKLTENIEAWRGKDEGVWFFYKMNDVQNSEGLAFFNSDGWSATHCDRIFGMEDSYIEQTTPRPVTSTWDFVYSKFKAFEAEFDAFMNREIVDVGLQPEPRWHVSRGEDAKPS